MGVTELDEHLKSHIPRGLRTPAPGDGLPAFEEAGPLPSFGDPYMAASMPANHGLTRLCCVMGREGFRPGGQAYRYFQYAQLDSDGDLGYTENGQRFKLRFACRVPKLIVVEGRNLLRICDYIQWHRMAWIRLADRDFGQDGLSPTEPVITALSITDWRPRDRGE
jgi:hypothetical protein